MTVNTHSSHLNFSSLTANKYKFNPAKELGVGAEMGIWGKYVSIIYFVSTFVLRSFILG